MWLIQLRILRTNVPASGNRINIGKIAPEVILVSGEHCVRVNVNLESAVPAMVLAIRSGWFYDLSMVAFYAKAFHDPTKPVSGRAMVDRYLVVDRKSADLGYRRLPSRLRKYLRST